MSHFSQRRGEHTHRAGARKRESERESETGRLLLAPPEIIKRALVCVNLRRRRTTGRTCLFQASFLLKNNKDPDVLIKTRSL